jgi:hypothetical protein
MNTLPTPDPSERVDVAPPRRSTTRRNAVLGVAGGLLAGGTIGLLVAAPTFTSAAPALGVSDNVEQDVEGDEQGDVPAAEPDEDAAGVPGTRLRDALQPLVDDGTITSEQADAVAEHLATEVPGGGERRGGWGRRHPGFDGEVVAEAIGIDVAELREQLRAGSSIADIATANGVAPQAVIDQLVAEVDRHLDLAVEGGRLTEAEAAEKLAAAEERITARVNGERPTRRGASDEPAEQPADDDASTTDS